MKKLSKTLLAFCSLALASCDASEVVNYNINRQANAFEIYRKFSLVNLRSDTILMDITGYLSISNSQSDGATTELAITIKTGDDEYKKHYCYIGGEVCYLVEQLENTTTDKYHWEIRMYWTVPEIIWG